MLRSLESLQSASVPRSRYCCASSRRCSPRQVADPDTSITESNHEQFGFITGAGSGLGAGTAKVALKAGDRVAATGGNIEKVRNALRDVASENLALVQLDVSKEAQARRPSMRR
jgi:hypothetical protein